MSGTLCVGALDGAESTTGLPWSLLIGSAVMVAGAVGSPVIITGGVITGATGGGGGGGDGGGVELLVVEEVVSFRVPVVVPVVDGVSGAVLEPTDEDDVEPGEFDCCALAC